MELKDFIVDFADQFDDTDISEIKSDTVFHDLDEWSSLIAMGVIALAIPVFMAAIIYRKK